MNNPIPAIVYKAKLKAIIAVAVKRNDTKRNDEGRENEYTTVLYYRLQILRNQYTVYLSMQIIQVFGPIWFS